MAEEVKHVGFKTLGLVIGIVLAAIWFILDILQNWLPGVDWPTVVKSIGIFGAIVIIVPLLCYLAHLLWKAMHVFEDLIG